MRRRLARWTVASQAMSARGRVTLRSVLGRFLQVAWRSVAARRYARGHRQWRAKWAELDFAPSWRITSPSQLPRELIEAVETSWFPAGASLLDIGCGSGEIAAWLAARGYDVLGVDYAEPAVVSARSRYGSGGGRLRFETVDICSDVPLEMRFQSLFDRGCFHAIPPAFAVDYVRNIASYSAIGARLLLLCGTQCGNAWGTSHRELADVVMHLFQGTFDVVRVEPTSIERSSGPKPEAPLPAIAAWMIRRDLT